MCSVCFECTYISIQTAGDVYEVAVFVSNQIKLRSCHLCALS